MHAGVPRRRRARPVADAPIDPLLARVDDLAKGWLVALLEQLPLARASSVMAAELARDGPRICDAVIRALADDNDLRRLGPDGALEALASRAGDVSGGSDAATASGAIDALHAVIWSALRGELSDPEPEQVSELAERLALVIGTVRGAALRRPGTVEEESPGVEQEPLGAEDEPPGVEEEPTGRSKRSLRSGLRWSRRSPCAARTRARLCGLVRSRRRSPGPRGPELRWRCFWPSSRRASTWR